MQRLKRATAGLAIATAAMLGASFAEAATPEQLYLAARDAAIAKLKTAVAAEKRGPMDNYGDEILAMEEKARAGLQQQMRAIIGPVAIVGINDEGALNLDTLIEGDQNFGMLDGMVYGGVDAKTRVIVTTASLFRRWLRQHRNWWGNNSENIPQQASAAVQAAGFYTQAILTDSAVVRYAALPVRKPLDATFATAMLAARTQSEIPDKADEIFVAMARNDRVFIAYTKEFAAVGPIAACDAIRRRVMNQASEAADEPGRDDEARREKSDALSGNSETEFLRCFATKASDQNSFAAAAKAAQTLIDRLPGH